MLASTEVPLLTQILIWGFAIAIVFAGLTYPENLDALRKWIKNRDEARKEMSAKPKAEDTGSIKEPNTQK